LYGGRDNKIKKRMEEYYEKEHRPVYKKKVLWRSLGAMKAMFIRSFWLSAERLKRFV
jgi:hypothetical protein